ncbi:MAG: hypothetical protein HY724_03300 [Candidatus Rokubacteria bacterium]|nr:hypothetical protein [Candidatus Rokubacteria bacterium]
MTWAPETRPEEGFTAQVYRDAWAFLREAEACAEEGRKRLAQTYARAAVLHAVLAAEAFLAGVVASVPTDPGLDSKVASALRALGGAVARNPRLGEEWRRLSAAREAIEGLGQLPEGPGLEDQGESVSSLRDELRKRMLDLAIAHCRENPRERRLSKDLGLLSDLRSEMGRRTLRGGPLARRWFEGATGLAGDRLGPAEVARDFQRVVLKARGESASGAAQGVAVEEARLACGAVRSMIAGFCGAAGRDLPQWVREIHDRLRDAGPASERPGDAGDPSE